MVQGWRLWLVAIGVLSLAGCVTGFRYELPKPNMRPLSVLGYDHSKETDRHAFYLSPVRPELREHWKARQYLFGFIPFGEVRGAKWCGEACFETLSRFPFGLPTVKGESCGLNSYQGIKVEPNITKEVRAAGSDLWVLEYHPVEQRSFRWKCDMDQTAPGYPKWENMAGY